MPQSAAIPPVETTYQPRLRRSLGQLGNFPSCLFRLSDGGHSLVVSPDRLADLPIRRLGLRWLPRRRRPDPPRNPTDRLRTVANGRAKGKLTEGQAERLTERIVRDALTPEDVDLLDSLADD